MSILQSWLSTVDAGLVREDIAALVPSLSEDDQNDAENDVLSHMHDREEMEQAGREQQGGEREEGGEREGGERGDVRVIECDLDSAMNSSIDPTATRPSVSELLLARAAMLGGTSTLRRG